MNREFQQGLATVQIEKILTMDVLFIRHGQSENNARPEHERVEDPVLTELGRKQVAILATTHLRVRWADVIITSPFMRALQTADILSRFVGCHVEVWRDVHEQGGCYSGYRPDQYEGRPGLTRRQIQCLFPGFIVERAIGEEEGWWGGKPYESVEQAEERARTVLDRLVADYADRRITLAVVTHADFLRALLSVLAPKGYSPAMANERIYNASVTMVRWQSDPSLMCWNTVDHLPPAYRTH